MNLPFFNSALPKPDLNINANSVQSPLLLGNGPIHLKSGAGADTITAAEMFTGITVVEAGASNTITIPVSSVIDTFLADVKWDDSTQLTWRVVSKASADVTFSSSDQPGVVIPQRQASGRATTTNFYFVRNGGLWLCANA